MHQIDFRERYHLLGNPEGRGGQTNHQADPVLCVGFDGEANRFYSSMRPVSIPPGANDAASKAKSLQGKFERSKSTF